MRARVRALVAIATTACAIAVTTPPAHAFGRPAVIRLNEYQRKCPYDYLCMYEEPYFDGGGFGVLEGFALNDFDGVYFKDEMSSWVNRTDTRYCWFQSDNYLGIGYIMRRGTAVSLMRPGRDNTASSLAQC